MAGLAPGTALDVGCGEGGDVIWLARQGWRVTGADFSANGLARARRHAGEAGVADRIDWWQVDARTFAADGRSYDLVTTHFLHPPDDGMVEVKGLAWRPLDTQVLSWQTSLAWRPGLHSTTVRAFERIVLSAFRPAGTRRGWANTGHPPNRPNDAATLAREGASFAA